ncbi:MAG: cell division protein FtsZ [Firmicutes bacterium]|nr:cell division protein FtsZ [Bacillota bacterium]
MTSKIESNQTNADLSDQASLNKAPIVKILVVGVGGGGSNAVDCMIKAGVQHVGFVAVNTDFQALERSISPIRLQIGKKITGGFGAGADPEIGERSALESEIFIKDMLKDAEIVFVTAGMGGGTGTGAAPVIARIAKEMGKLTIGVVTKPFDIEGGVRTNAAQMGIANLSKNVDTLVIVPNEKLIEQVAELTMIEAMAYADEMLHQAIRAITGVILDKSVINVDFADLKRILKGMGTAHMGIGYGKGQNKTLDAVKSAVASKLLETTITGASKAILHFLLAPNVRLDEVNKASKMVKDELAENPEFIFGFGVDDRLEDEVFVTIIATGFDQQANHRGQQQQSRPRNGEPYKPPQPPESSTLGGLFDDDDDDYVQGGNNHSKSNTRTDVGGGTGSSFLDALKNKNR